MSFIDHKRTANILAILGLVVAIIGLLIPNPPTTGATGTVTHWTRTDIYWIIIICVIALSNAGYFMFTRRNKTREQEVIGKLSILQESYILTPHYVTATEHADHSKEGALSKGGTANILTNSLKYDIFYSDAIAKNIIRGATYIYILPDTSLMIADLKDYISTISESIQKELQTQNFSGVVNKVDELLSQNLEFWFFDKENSCLYNFAIFRQTAEGGQQPFVQYWWYINPSDTDQNSPMLTYEMLALREKGELDDVFKILKHSARKKSGKGVFDNRLALNDWILNNE